MTVRQAVIGSPTWVERVFSSPEAREVWGLSRPTQRYGVRGPNGLPQWAEGGNEATARALMVLGQTTGQILRWKSQPFALEKATHGMKAVPDLMFQTANGSIYVAEPRSCRFLNAKKLAETKAVEKVLSESGLITYLFWTDLWPLCPATTRLVRELRRCGTAAIPVQSINALAEVLQAGPKSFFELRQLGYFRDVVMAAVWHGRAHIDLYKAVHDSTVVSADLAQRGFEKTLIAPVRSQSIWSEMKPTSRTAPPRSFG